MAQCWITDARFVTRDDDLPRGRDSSPQLELRQANVLAMCIGAEEFPYRNPVQ